VIGFIREQVSAPEGGADIFTDLDSSPSRPDLLHGSTREITKPAASAPPGFSPSDAFMLEEEPDGNEDIYRELSKEFSTAFDEGERNIEEGWPNADTDEE